MRLKSKFIKCLIIFTLSFPLILFIWYWIKDYYAISVIKISVFFTDLIYNFEFKGIKIAKELMYLDLSRQLFAADGSLVEMLMTIKIKPSAFTFNFPLTISLFFSILPIVKINRYTIIEVLLFLFFIHFAYVFTLCGLQQHNYLLQAHLIKPNSFAKIFWQFGWSFTDNLLIRFEPFLVAVYIYLRKGKWFFEKKEENKKSD